MAWKAFKPGSRGKVIARGYARRELAESAESRVQAAQIYRLPGFSHAATPAARAAPSITAMRRTTTSWTSTPAGAVGLHGRAEPRDPGERRLVDVLDRVTLRTAQDILAMLPALPPEPFSTRELAEALRCSTLLAQRTLSCLQTIGIVVPAGKRGRAPVHALIRP